MSLAAGVELFGCEGPGHPVRALFVEMEDDQHEIQRRWKRCLDLLREDPKWTADVESHLLQNWRSAVPEWESGGEVTLLALVPWIVAQAEAQGGVELIVLDTYAALATGEENAADVQRAFWAACYTVASATGACVLVIHHVRKMGQQGAKGPAMTERLSFDMLRGSSAIVAGARAILQVEPLTREEAGRLSLDEERAAAGNYIVLALTKHAGGPKGGWIALEQRQSFEPGAGFFAPMADGERICARLRSKGAEANLNIAETVLLSISKGCDDRAALARMCWPSDPPSKQASKLKGMLTDMRRKHRWLQPGRGLAMTVTGFEKARALRGVEAAASSTFSEGEFDENH